MEYYLVFLGVLLNKIDRGENVMGLKLACKDLDPEGACPYVVKGENMEELKADLFRHAKAVHNYTDEQLNDPKMLAKVKELVKED